MKPNGSRSRFPDLGRLTTGLNEIFPGKGSNQRVTVLERKRNPYESTFPTEIVTCRADGGRRLRLFIKYGTKTFDAGYGHRGDVGYEARVYRDVLQPLRTSTPAFYGVRRPGPKGAPWLVIGYLNGGIRTSYSRDPNAMIQAARWIGRFHATNGPRARDRSLAFLRKYDRAYYRGWPRRTERSFAPWHRRFPWIAPMCRKFESRVPILLDAPQTVIHGEYFGQNIVYRNGMSWPADWQSTAIAPGEIDLASLTHSWPRALVRRCEREYRKARWPNRIPEDFEEVLAAARLYVNFRWLGDARLMTPSIGPSGRLQVQKLTKKFLKDLYAAGKTLGWVE